MILTINYAEPRFTISAQAGEKWGLTGSYDKSSFNINNGRTSIVLRNQFQPAIVPFILRTDEPIYQFSTIIVDGIEYTIDYTSAETIAATLEVMYLILSNAFNGVESTPTNIFDFVSAPSLEDFATTLGAALVFPIKAGNRITFWNKGYVIPSAAFTFGSLTGVKTLATDIGAGAFSDNSQLKTLIADSTTIIQESAFDKCPQLNETSFLSVTELQSSAFLACTSKQDFTFPSIEAITGDGTFKDCTSATNFTFGPNLTQLGASLGNNEIFKNIIGNTITVTIPMLFQTNDGGNMQPDLINLAADNTVAFNWI